MKFFNGLKESKTQSHLIGIMLYGLGMFFNVNGHINAGVQTFAYVFLGAFAGYASSLAIIWYINNKKLLKAAKWHFILLFLGIPMIFITWFKKLYVAFAFTIVFVCVIAILFIVNLCRICSAYYYDDWK